MIRNLNQITIQSYGTVLSERAQNPQPENKDAVTLKLNETEALVYRAAADTLLSPGTGMSVLSLDDGSGDFRHYYLDKSVTVHKDMLFALSAFKGEASARVHSRIPPESVEMRVTRDLRMDHRLRAEGIYTFFYQEKEQGFLFPGESHPMPELTYVDQGELHSVADGQDLLLKQGDMVIYGPNQWHMQYAEIGVAPRFVTISFDLAGGELTPLLNRKFQAPQGALMLLQNMLREQERMDAYSSDIILAQLSLLLLTLLREDAAPSGRKLQGANVIHSENEIIRLAQQYITNHIREKLTVPMVARQVDVSPSYLTVLFHKNLQISPGEYIRRIKLQESKQMIRENNLNFTEIASALQYSTVHHFSRQFKEKFGITPTEYARAIR